MCSFEIRKSILILARKELIIMQKKIKRFKFLLILIPLGLFIGFLDQNLIKGFVDPKKIGDHYQYMGILVVAVLVLLFLIIQFDRNSEQK